MIGSIIGVGVANQLMNVHTGTSGVDWEQATKVFKVLLISPLVGFGAPRLLFLLCQGDSSSTRPSTRRPKDNTPPPWPIRALLVLTCTGVSFFHGSNDGQKGMGLIMLILIGTVPTAYALNHAVTRQDVQDFIAASEQAGTDPRRARRQERGILGADARADVTDYHPHQEIAAGHHSRPARTGRGPRATKSASTRSSRRFPPSQQTNVRNDMYVASEAIRLMQKNHNPAFTAGRERRPDQLQGQGRQGHQVHPHLGQGRRRSGAGHGHHGRLEAHRRHRRRKDRQGAPDLRAGRLRRAGRHGHHLCRRQLRPAGQYHARAESGVAGTMAANRSGLQLSTIRNIAAAWVFTLPAAALLSGLLFWLFRQFSH